MQHFNKKLDNETRDAIAAYLARKAPTQCVPHNAAPSGHVNCRLAAKRARKLYREQRQLAHIGLPD